MVPSVPKAILRRCFDIASRSPVDEQEMNADMFATADETSEEITELFRRACAHAGATIDELDLTTGHHVPWWGQHSPITLQRVVRAVSPGAPPRSGSAPPPT